MVNEYEEIFRQEAKKRGYGVLQRGYPDFLVVGNNVEPFFVEVKSGYCSLSVDQEDMIGEFRKMGLKVFLSPNGKWIETKNLVPKDEREKEKYEHDIKLLNERIYGLVTTIYELNLSIKKLEQELKDINNPYKEENIHLREELKEAKHYNQIYKKRLE